MRKVRMQLSGAEEGTDIGYGERRQDPRWRDVAKRDARTTPRLV